MRKPLDLIGRRIGQVIVLQRNGSNEAGRSLWQCKCSCGHVFDRTGEQIKRSLVRTTAYQGCDSCHTRRTLRPYEWLYNALCHSAQVLQRKNTLTYEEFLKFTKQPQCHYCLAWLEWNPFQYKGARRRKRRYNLDCKDPALDYVRENLVPCCPRCNLSKRNVFTYAEWYCMTGWFRRIKCQSQ
jgi:hypothetical protein